jgi:hypothetical protein
VGVTPGERVVSDVKGALRRRPANEEKLAGVARAVACVSAELRAALADAVETLAARGAYTRPLYAAAARALAEHGDRRVVAPLKRALARDDAGGLASLSAACFVEDASLRDPLVRIATSRTAHVAFAAEVARVARGESDGQHIAALAPMIKESHRIELCCELFVPLRSHAKLPSGIAPALAVLRDAERHLGRWLLLAEIATRAGDPKPLAQARERSESGPGSARAAWAMVAWALAQGEPPPDVRPTLELVARLSDRPSSDRDTTFLYRLAASGAPTAKSMLETVVKGSGLGSDASIRAALHLARDYGRDDLKNALANAVKSPKREALRGLAAAALFDVGERGRARELAPDLVASRQLTTVGWGTLLSAVDQSSIDRMVTESTFRRVQLGCVQ